MNSEKRKVILLIAAVVIIAALAFAYAYAQLFGSKNETPVDNQYANFPTSGSSEVLNSDPIDDTLDFPTQPAETPVYITETVIETTETDWRDEIVQVSSLDTGSAAAAYNKQTVVDSSNAQSNLDDLYAASDSLSQLVKNITKSSPLPNGVPNEPMSFSEYSALFDLPKITSTSIIKCGNVDMPSNENEAQKFMSNFHNDKSAICMGQAIANNCATAKITVSEFEDYPQTLYVSKGTDGTCGIGSTFSSKNVSLCSVKEVMNAITGKDKEFLEWQKDFRAEPGKTFSSLYNGFTDGLMKLAESKSLDCQSFEL